MEKRTYNIKPEVRAEGGNKFIEGTAAQVNVSTVIYNSFTESIEPGAFDDVLNDDIRCLFNHGADNILGRTNAGTLRVFIADNGDFAFECTVSESRQIAKDVYDMVSVGDVSQCSFAFKIKESKWTFATEPGGLDHRTILKFEKIYDVGPVTYPAYEGTEVHTIERAEARSKHNTSRVNGPANLYTSKLINLKLKAYEDS